VLSRPGEEHGIATTPKIEARRFPLRRIARFHALGRLRKPYKGETPGSATSPSPEAPRPLGRVRALDLSHS
jgi:hypothetical protein